MIRLHMTFEKHPKSDNLDFLFLCFLATSCLSNQLTKYVIFLIPRSYTLFMWNSCFLLNHSKLCSCSACKTACKMKTITTGKVKVNFKAKMASLSIKYLPPKKTTALRQIWKEANRSRHRCPESCSWVWVWAWFWAWSLWPQVGSPGSPSAG